MKTAKRTGVDTTVCATAVKKKGFSSLNQACRRVDLPYSTLVYCMRHGLSENPREQTVKKLEQMGLLHLFRRTG